MSLVLESLDALRQRKHDEAAVLATGKAALWAKAEALGRCRNLENAVSGGGVVRCVVGDAPEHLPSGQALAVITDAVVGGSGLACLAAWRGRSDVPILWWDHVVSPVQIAEARLAGADAVRITLALVDDDGLDDCLAAAERAGCAAIVMVDDMDGARRALTMGAEMIAGTGLNPGACRELGARLVFDIVRNGSTPVNDADAIIAGSAE